MITTALDLTKIHGAGNGALTLGARRWLMTAVGEAVMILVFLGLKGG